MTYDSARSAHIERTLRQCAVELHPSGQWQHLADAMGVTPKVFRYWWTKARVPAVKAKWLENRFPAIVNAASLTG